MTTLGKFDMSTAVPGLSPRTQITKPSERATDPAFAYFIRYFEPKGTGRLRGTLILWTDSREYAVQFAKSHHVYARPSRVQERREWSDGRSIGLSESELPK